MAELYSDDCPGCCIDASGLSVPRCHYFELCKAAWHFHPDWRMNDARTDVLPARAAYWSAPFDEGGGWTFIE